MFGFRYCRECGALRKKSYTNGALYEIFTCGHVTKDHLTINEGVECLRRQLNKAIGCMESVRENRDRLSDIVHAVKNALIVPSDDDDDFDD